MGILKNPDWRSWLILSWSHPDQTFSCLPLWDIPKMYLHYMRQPHNPTGFISPQKALRLLTTIHPQPDCKYHCACMHVCVSVHSGSFICILSQAGRQAGFWQGPELWNGLSSQFCRWLDQPIPLYLAEGSPNPTAAVPFCEILFHFTTLTDKIACTHACASPRPHATFI